MQGSVDCVKDLHGETVFYSADGQLVPFAPSTQSDAWRSLRDDEPGHDSNCGPVGASWGSTAALASSGSQPQHGCAMVTRGEFSGMGEEIDHPFQRGMAKLFPNQCDRIQAGLPDPAGRTFSSYYAERHQRNDSSEAARIALPWTRYEAAASQVDSNGTQIGNLRARLKQDITPARALFERVCMTNGCFPSQDKQLQNIDRIASIPACIVNGRFDAVCSPEAARRLRKPMPLSKLLLTFASGYGASEAETQRDLLTAFHEIEEQFGTRETGAGI